MPEVSVVVELRVAVDETVDPVDLEQVAAEGRRGARELYRVKGEAGSFHPLDRTMGLAQSEPSPALREAVCDLATRVPYRQVAHLTTRLTGRALTGFGVRPLGGPRDRRSGRVARRPPGISCGNRNA